MRALSRFAAALRGWFRPGSLDYEVAEELRFHVDRQIQANIDRGMTPTEARQAAHLLVGNIDALREESRAARPGALAHQAARDLAFGARLLRRTPGFALTAILIVALGTGTTTAIFSVLYGVMLRPLPFPDPDRLVGLWTRPPQADRREHLNPADHRELRGAASNVFEDIALVWPVQNFNLIGSGEPERLFAARVSSNLFSVLGVTPAIGRTFTDAEDETGNERFVLLSDGLWRRRFGGDPSIVGRTINLTGTQFQVVGVMPPGFPYPGREHQLWVPLTINPAQLDRRVGGFDHTAVARLKKGVSMAQAQAALDTLATGLEARFPATHRGVRLEVAPLLDEALRPVRSTLYILLAAVSCLLLIACLNLANLLGTRAAGRAREYTLRLALGASRGRLLLQALAEVTPVLCLGGAAGIVGARAAIASFVPIAPAALPRVESIAVNGPVLMFSIGLLALTGLAASLLPAMSAWRATLSASQERGATGTRQAAKTRHLLVVAQLALALPLVVGATALVRSFASLMQVDPGFRVENVLTMHFAISRAKYTNDTLVAAYCSRIVERVAALPGVVSAAMVNRLPLAGGLSSRPFQFENVETPLPTLQTRSVTPGYFRTMSIPIVAGRDFTDRDLASAPLVGIVDDRLARALWPGQTAIGRRFRVTLPGQQPSWGEIVGIVGHIRHAGLENEDDRLVYFSHHQYADGRTALAVRTRDDVRPFLPAVLQGIREIDQEQPVYEVRTLEDVLERSAAEEWLNTAIITTFAFSALVLAGVGLYGVIAYGVTQRIREFGVRFALGAQRSDVIRLVLGKAAILAACGAPLGLIGAVLLLRAMRTMLFNVHPLDPAVFGAAGLVMFAVALLASYLPARRASRSDPCVALRSD
jgi:putative ABC transport system permease protein